MLRQADDLVVAGHGVDGAVDPHAAAVGKVHSLAQLVGIKVSGESTHTKVRARQIDRVGAVFHGHPQPLHISCRSQQFRFLSHISYRYSRRC